MHPDKLSQVSDPESRRLCLEIGNKVSNLKSNSNDELIRQLIDEIEKNVNSSDILNDHRQRELMDKFIAIQSSVDDVLTQQFEKLFRLIDHLNSRMITIKCISDAVVDIKLVFGYEGMRALETW